MAVVTAIYLSNFASHRTPGAHGPGRKFTIMARPRSWEWGAGRVESLAPMGDLEPMMIAALTERAGGLVDGPEMAAYRGAFEASLARLDMRPGYLAAHRGIQTPVYVLDGDTLCCACSVAHARAGLCHRAWLAPAFRAFGWRVVLDGVETP